MQEKLKSHRNSILKSIVWRIMGVLILGSLTYAFTRHWITTTTITFVHHATFLLVFYLHERFWKRIKLQGKVRNLIKALVYEVILGMGIGGAIVLFFTGSWKAVTNITVVYTIIKIITYYFYDRIWKE
jgi:uncharacterized membrane protein